MRNRRRYAMVAVARRNGAAMWVKLKTESKNSCDGSDDGFLTKQTLSNLQPAWTVHEITSPSQFNHIPLRLLLSYPATR